MSLSRAFTTRRLWPSNDIAATDRPSLPRRNSSTVKGPVLRHKISAPIQLIHTTNMLSYNAPDLPRASRSNSTNTKSDDDSDTPTAAESTPPTSPDVGPGEPSSSSPEPNHLTSYFKNPGRTLAAAEAAPPAIPKRSPSHTKKNSFDAIARSRSASRASRDSDLSGSTRPGHAFSRSPSTSTLASSGSHTPSPHSQKQTAPAPVAPAPAASFQPQRPSKDTHPFGQELAQVTELAEEYGATSRLPTIDEEQLDLDARGLVKLSANEYLGAIQSISAAFFPEATHVAPPAPLWI